MHFRPGDTIDEDWRLDAELGRGATGQVFAATHLRTGLRAAIKLIPSARSDETLRARLVREARAANQVGHRGAVRILSDGEHEGVPYLVMDLVEGESLKQRFPRGTCAPLDEVARIVDELLDILTAAHAAGVVHRDIKPDNVLVSSDGSLRVVDFGIAKLRESSGSGDLTETGSMLGTPAYMPPEQARGRFREVDGRSDLFSVAAVARALLSGRGVHEGSTAAEVLISAATRPVGPTREVAPTLGPEVAAVLDRALSFDKDGRFPDPSSMRAAWRAAVAAPAPRPVTSKTIPLVAAPSQPDGPAASATASPHAGVALGARGTLVLPQPARVAGSDAAARTARLPRLALWIIAGSVGIIAVSATVVGVVLLQDWAAPADPGDALGASLVSSPVATSAKSAAPAQTPTSAASATTQPTTLPPGQIAARLGALLASARQEFGREGLVTAVHVAPDASSVFRPSSEGWHTPYVQAAGSSPPDGAACLPEPAVPRPPSSETFRLADVDPVAIERAVQEHMAGRKDELSSIHVLRKEGKLRLRINLRSGTWDLPPGPASAGPRFH